MTADLPNGTYIRYRHDHGCTRIAVIVGTDIGATKYEVGQRFAGWGRWLFGDGGWWVSPTEIVETLTEQEAHT